MLLESSQRAAAPSVRLAVYLRLAAILAAIVMALPALRDAAVVHGPPLTEDGYYALTVARNLAHGHGMTIDGTTLSNGFQPLFTVIESLAFTLGGASETLAIRWVFLFAWLFHVAGALMCAAFVRDLWPARHGTEERDLRGPLAAIFYLGSPLLFGHAYNGLATGCVLFFYLTTLRHLQTGGAETARGRLLLGMLIGLLVLARIDAAFFAVSVGLWLLWTNRQAGIASAIARAGIVAVVALAVSGPWWAYNLLDFGSVLPTSGGALQATGLTPPRAHYALWALRAVFMPWLFFGQMDDYFGYATSLPYYWGFGYISAASTLRLVLIALLGFALWRAIRRRAFDDDLARLRTSDMRDARRGLVALGLLAAAMLPLVVYYAFFFGSYWFYYRYFMPVAILPFVAAPLVAARLQFATLRACRFAAAAIVAAGAQAILWPVLAYQGWTFNPGAVYFDQVKLVAANVPPSETVAAGQSGTLGYFRDHVVNTDGKVNLDALHYKGRIWEYLRLRKINWYVDWPFYVSRHIGVPLDAATGLPVEAGNGWKLKAQRNGFYLYHYEPPAQS
ncbi:MAG: hypothetical protein GC202_12160 [Alphaproteobacteria bacterium]|nr:hypothetical protein [Alphaproteobacteria bacterium]